MGFLSKLILDPHTRNPRKRNRRHKQRVNDALFVKKRRYLTQKCTAGIDKLPDDLLITILSYLSFKEAVRTSVLARKWRYLSHKVPYDTWSEDQVIVILNSIIEFEKKEAKQFSLVTDIDPFFDTVKDKLPVNVTKGHLFDKIVELEKGYHERQVLFLAEIIWGDNDDLKKQIEEILCGNAISSDEDEEDDDVELEEEEDDEGEEDEDEDEEVEDLSSEEGEGVELFEGESESEGSKE